MSAEQAVRAYLDRIVGAGVVGAIGLVEDADGLVCLTAGRMSVDGPPMPSDAIIRIQSMTKTVTAVAALRLVEAGLLSLDDPVSTWLPELADPRVLRTPESTLDDTVPVARPITVRHLLNLTSGHGIAEGTPYHEGQVSAGVDAGPEPVVRGADEWLAALATLPLFHQPGEGWLYHHGYMLTGILIGRLTGRPYGDHLADDVFAPLGMVDTGFWAHDPARLPAAYRLEDDGPVETEPADAGHYAGDPGFDVAHGELVSAASDYLRFARMLRDRGLSDGVRYLSAESVAAITSDQVPDEAKTPHSFGANLWQGGSWGYGVFVEGSGRYGWSGGQGTDYSVDPASGRITILLTQVEMGPTTWGAITGFRDVLAGWPLGQTVPTADDGVMKDAITADEFAAHEGLHDWRVADDAATARFHTGSFATGVELVVAIGRDADAADHHPDVDLRYDHVDVRLASHDVGGLSRRDVALARRISAAARAVGATADPDHEEGES